MARHPGDTIPQLGSSTYGVKAAYTLFGHPETTPETVQAPHRAVVQSELAKPGRYLLIEDASEFTWPEHPPRSGLGPMHPGRQGFVLQSSLAVRWSWSGGARRGPLEILGLVQQTFHARVPRPADEANEASYRRQVRPRESDLWFAGLAAFTADPAAGVRLIHVADRGADLYRYLQGCRAKQHGFVVRAAQNRKVGGAEPQPLGRSLDRARQQPSLGAFDLELRARPGQAARTAHLSLSAVRLLLPGRGGGSAAAPPLSCTLVRVWEAQPPAGVDALEWFLMCDQEVTTVTGARECACIYAARWLVEEFHKGLKTGLKADTLALQTAPRLFAAIALKSVVAVRLLALREAFRLEPQRPATCAGLDADELLILAALSHRVLLTVQDVGLALGRLGGHLNRTRDGPPGWLTLWRGLDRLHALAQGFRLARSGDGFG